MVAPIAHDPKRSIATINFSAQNYAHNSGDGMINSILAAAIGGGLGGAIGSGAVPLFRVIFKKDAAWGAGASRVVLAIFAVTGMRAAPYFNKPSIEETLDRVPVFSTIHRYFPGDYANIVSSLKGRDLSDQAAVRSTVYPYLTGILSRRKRELSDESANNLMSLAEDEAKIIMKDNPKDCIAFATGKGASVNLASEFSPEMRQRDFDVTGKVLEQVATQPAPPAQPLSEADQTVLAQKALLNMTPEDRSVVIPLLSQNKTPSTDGEMKAVCEFYVSIIGAALADRPDTVRRMMASS